MAETTEQQTEKTATRPATVGELEVTEFFGILAQILDRKREVGDPKLLDLSVKEFTALMLDQLRTRSMKTAQLEADTASRILTDWEGLKGVGAVTQPHRVTTPEEAIKFGESLAAPLRQNMKGEFVIAVAIVSPGGTYGSLVR